MHLSEWQVTGWWSIAIFSFITPFVIFTSPARVISIVAGAATLNIWGVILVADTCSVAALLIQYALFRLFGVSRFLGWLARWPSVHQTVEKFRHRMVVLQLVLNASPLPDFVLPLVAASTRERVWRFALTSFIGRLFHILPMMFLGFILRWTRNFWADPTELSFLSLTLSASFLLVLTIRRQLKRLAP